jgi:hypothetical protein
MKTTIWFDSETEKEDVKTYFATVIYKETQTSIKDLPNGHTAWKVWDCVCETPVWPAQRGRSNDRV